MFAAIVVGRMIVNVVNDILDEEKDRLTAPELPLPSRLVTLPEAALTAGGLTILLLLLLWTAGNGLTGFLLGAGGITAGGLFIGVYSFVKPYAVVSMVVTGCAFVSGAMTAWLVGGGGVSLEIGLVVLYAFLRGNAANVFSTIRDIDLDSEVGNRSVAVRLGWPRALVLGVSIETLASLCILGVAVLKNHVFLGAIVVAGGLSLLMVSFVMTARIQRNASGRYERASGSIPINLGRQHVGIALVESIPAGVGAALVTAAAFFLEDPLYRRRIIEGHLRDGLDEAERQTDSTFFDRWS